VDNLIRAERTIGEGEDSASAHERSPLYQVVLCTVVGISSV
jgi:hypothetical protein